MALAIWNSTITDQQGNVIPNARVEVRRESDGALVALYSDRNGTVGKGNPFNADGAGFVYFHCIGGAYRITATGSGQTQQWRYVPIGTAQELDAGAFSENAGWNAVENTPAGLANHTSASAGYRVLVINADGNGRAAVYEKMGAGSNWSAPIWITGVQGSNGPPNTLTIGTVTQTPTPQVTITGETPNQVLNFGLVKGDTGDVTPEAIAARDAAIAAKNSAESSATSATSSASTATTKASEASTSAAAASASQIAAATSAATAVTNATNAGNSAAAALSSANSANASASTATTKAVEASASADVAFTHRQAAAASASSAAASATDADTAKTGAETARTQAAASATAASGSATTAGNSASAASGSASTATTQATNAGNSATAAAASASTANTAKTDAQAAAVVASTKAGESASSATASAGSATTSATRAGESAVSATNSANSASAAAGSAGTATTKAAEATTARDYAYQWSSAPQDTQVNDGTHTGFSAYHWSRVAETAAGGGILSVNGKTGAAITLDAADVGALATLVAGTNITITGGGDTRTINATVAAQVNSDWNATSGISQILNKPVLGTASAQNVSAFATSAQGVKADSALQTLTAGTNVTVVKSGTSYTINATSSPQVQSDWNATSGLGVILNKPTLGTAAAQDIGYFATAAQGAKADTALQNASQFATSAQGVKADSALQTLTAGTNITISGTGTTRTINANVPAAPVTSVNTKTGAVVLSAVDVGALGATAQAADSAKLNGKTAEQLPLSTAVQAALNEKAGVYKGSDVDEVNFPIGHTIAVTTTTAAPITRNGLVSPRLNPTINYFYSSAGSGTLLTGVWRSRCYVGTHGNGFMFLVERVEQ